MAAPIVNFIFSLEMLLRVFVDEGEGRWFYVKLKQEEGVGGGVKAVTSDWVMSPKPEAEFWI